LANWNPGTEEWELYHIEKDFSQANGHVYRRCPDISSITHI
jgi:hypothetical protein